MSLHVCGLTGGFRKHQEVFIEPSKPQRCLLLFRTREDTVRQIVAGLTGDAEGCTDLASELSRGDPVTLEMQDSDDEGTDPEDWTPDPTDAVPGR